MPPHPPLPPLPALGTWSKTFVRRSLAVPISALHRTMPHRHLIASRWLANEFVRSIGLREGELVVECWPGPGQTTRSLLRGGEEREESEEWDAYEAVAGETKGKRGSFPSWARPSVYEAIREPTAPLPKPGTVLVSESSPDILSRAFGPLQEPVEPITRGPYNPYVDGERLSPASVSQSPNHPNLFLSNSSVYRWNCIPDLLDNPAISSRFPGRKAWHDEPPLTVVAHFPDSMIGEQMISQWVGSAAGGQEEEAQWIWKWGRVRLAMFLPKTMYDRIMAGPGEPMMGRLSIFTSGLFHRQPLAPFHHVRNVDRRSERTSDTTPAGATALDTAPERTVVRPSDYYPLIHNSSSLDAFARPPFLGVMLTPRKESVIKGNKKHVWDYVLRNCFVLASSPFRESLPSLGFGADNLRPKLEAADGFLGDAVDMNATPREMTVRQWQRVVDVFDKWAFKPETLVFVNPSSTDTRTTHRQIGVD